MIVIKITIKKKKKSSLASENELPGYFYSEKLGLYIPKGSVKSK